MVKLSKLAEEVLSQTIKESDIPLGKGLRLERCEAGLTLITDSPSKGDRIIRKGRDPVLIINKELEKQIGEVTIDISGINKMPTLVIIKGGKGGKV